tara:strand:- start:492 stop:848 length:357 start_codon:yes stop_codon:yes gene_type:complete
MTMNQYKAEIKQHILDDIEETIDLFDEDLHHNLFNATHYIIGYYNASQWMKGNVFEIISIIKQYELDNFGEQYTDLSCPEKMANMFAYILGEEVIRDLIDEYDYEASMEYLEDESEEA